MFLCWILLLVLLSLPQTRLAVDSVIQKVHYVSWLEILNTNAGSWQSWHNTTSAKMLSEISNADDLNQRVNLPFSFPFLGVNRFVAFVGSNGYIQFDSSNSPPCISQISSSNDPYLFVCFQSSFVYMGKKYSNDFNNSYYGMISAFTADLYPAWKYPRSGIRWSKTNSSSTSGVDTVFFHFSEIPFYNFSMSRVNNTFHVRLRSDGGATIFYENVHYSTCQANAQKCSSFESFMSGLRSSESTTGLTQTSGQASVQTRVWHTLVKGVYPPSVSLIKSQTMFHMCPFSDSWCMTPRFAVKSTTAVTYLNLSTLVASCPLQFKAYKCAFGPPTGTSAVSAESAAYLNTTSTSLPITFSCQIPVSVMATAGNWTVDLLASAAKAVTTSKFVSGDAVDVTPQTTLWMSLLPPSAALALRVQNGALTTSQLSACAATSPLKAAASSVAGQCSVGECSACTSSGVSCLLNNVQCKSVASLEMCNLNPSASSTCHSSIPSSENKLYQSLFWSKLGTCCDAAQLDCAGNCKGGKYTAPRYKVDEFGKRSNVCCTGALDCDGYCGHTSAPKLDCNRDCGGTASYDGCGVCSGGKTGLAPTACKLQFKYSDNLLNSSIPFVSEQNWVGNKSGVAYRNITLHNTAHVQVNIVATLPQNPQVDPAVTFVGPKTIRALNERVLVLPANATMTIPIMVSIARAFRGKVDRWINKQIKFEYSPDSASYKTSSKGYLDVQIVVPNCDSIKTQKKCMIAPMCMWCQSSSARKVPLSSGSSSSSSSSSSRRLFNIIAPPAVQTTFETLTGQGFCSNGYDPDSACGPYQDLGNDDTTFNEAGQQSFVVVLSLVLFPVVVLLYISSVSTWSHLF